ncbi:aminoglycoside phosphotransferase family protein [Streptomyces rhizosphaericus]|uniref:aminoglycoside phosphotransferase family protein n=1 Tax=Streptomyces rhizosphaericus TaxID=114699 RepID=UPI000A3A511B|nr:aminoglycoside phosphotransferase family protein [Streptomyces rhizosphaericus]
MTTAKPAKPFPPELRDWVAVHLPGLDANEDCSWPRSTSRVWRVSAGSRDAYVKISPSTLDFEREVAGYAYAAAHLRETEAPRLLACDPHLRAILSSPLPGHVVRDLPLETSTELHLYEDAGRLLRRWHDASAPGTDADRAAVRSDMEDQAQEAADCLEHVTPHLAADRLALVKAASQELADLAEHLPLVYRHGDYETRNWLYDEATGHHGLIDFAMATHGVAASEFVWLCGAVWPKRPELREAYFTGYGRPLTADEDRLLQLLTVRLGVSYLRNGLANDRDDLVARGRLVLDRMAAHRP